jgi:hypothetical protein
MTRTFGRDAECSGDLFADGEGRWVPVQTVTLSPFHSATAARGSSGAWAMYSTVESAGFDVGGGEACLSEPLTRGSCAQDSAFFFRYSKMVALEGYSRVFRSTSHRSRVRRRARRCRRRAHDRRTAVADGVRECLGTGGIERGIG